MSSHKGSWSRVNNHKDWADNYDQIFRKTPQESPETITQNKQTNEQTTKHNKENRTMALTGSQINPTTSP
jgi:hypothetical protein